MQNKVRIATAAASSPASATARAAGTVPSTRLGLSEGSAWSPILAPISGLDKGMCLEVWPSILQQSAPLGTATAASSTGSTAGVLSLPQLPGIKTVAQSKNSLYDGHGYGDSV
jgi:hypothetical protein